MPMKTDPFLLQYTAQRFRWLHLRYEQGIYIWNDDMRFYNWYWDETLF